MGTAESSPLKPATNWRQREHSVGIAGDLWNLKTCSSDMHLPARPQLLICPQMEPRIQMTDPHGDISFKPPLSLAPKSTTSIACKVLWTRTLSASLNTNTKKSLWQIIITSNLLCEVWVDYSKESDSSPAYSVRLLEKTVALIN